MYNLFLTAKKMDHLTAIHFFVSLCTKGRVKAQKRELPPMPALQKRKTIFCTLDNHLYVSITDS